MMEYILAMADKSGGEVYMAFLRSGKLNIAVQTGRDFFELGTSSANIGSLRQKFLGELKWSTDIIDTLRVDDTSIKRRRRYDAGCCRYGAGICAHRNRFGSQIFAQKPDGVHLLPCTLGVAGADLCHLY